ncbi:MAG: fluoride efflux transporter CrcB [Planctomycetota bacterium]|nr:MAG: fluoride efflux transporter CrcB [Planctomycetota bacterium]
MKYWQLLLIFAAGGLGAVCRYAVSGWVQRFSETFPIGTLAVNVAGCFLFGTVVVLAGERGLLPPQARLPALTGFLGAFTTFSTYGYETQQLLSDAEWGRAALYLVANNGGGVFAVLLGMACGRLI